jgi:hypothetical protein
LGDAPLERTYIRITWRAASRLLSPVIVRSGTLITRPSAVDAGTFIEAVPPSISDDHVIEFGVPFATHLTTMRIVPTGSDVLVPIRIFGRNDREQPWTPIGDGTAARPGNGTPAGGAIVLSGGPYPMMRIEADRRSAGFTSVPTLRLGFAAHELVFLAAGRAPFVLAAGRAAAGDHYLPLRSMMTQAPDGPLATAKAATSNAVLRLPPVGSAERSGQILLWAVLLAATALLACMALLLWKRGTNVAT